ncbi:hypothetical protein PISL3812_08450 [Talaromyces islandicus]|uniref:Uncharacterized protein n=1 Tax=Talaromyces islandicus TaxID=28573 RepID=A0A0U1M7R7_TALIS|nr:hypothetical protein PISL3812_08450 [Talaromyces islandicus]
MPRSIFLTVAPLLALLCDSAVGREVRGYSHGQQIPVSCLNRTVDSGEHIEDKLGHLQYISFPTCNETSLPLALRYGVTETISCTIDSLSDDMYHLLYGDSTSGSSSSNKDGEYQVVGVDGDDGSGGGGSGAAAGGQPYTPLTIALQGTLQRSHLHIWTDMNVLMHQLSSVESPRKKSAAKYSSTPGYVVAGAAYSLPELHAKDGKTLSVEEEDAAIIENARNPWTAGHGTKVIRGEPLTLVFRVSWVPGADSLGWLDQYHHGHQGTTVLGVITKLIFFVMAAGIGALLASYYQKVVRRGAGWHGDGILGRPFKGRRGSTSGVTYGNGGWSNGYGGFAHSNVSVSSGVGNGGGYGYGGYGKKD